jgi:hypothetical protein
MIRVSDRVAPDKGGHPDRLSLTLNSGRRRQEVVMEIPHEKIKPLPPVTELWETIHRAIIAAGHKLFMSKYS